MVASLSKIISGSGQSEGYSLFLQTLFQILPILLLFAQRKDQSFGCQVPVVIVSSLDTQTYQNVCHRTIYFKTSDVP